MKHIRNYSSFIKESKKQIVKNGIIVEKQVLKEFSSDFWGLCLRSSVFTADEKAYIKENLSEKKVSLLNEEWDWLDKAVDWAKEKGEKMLSFVSDKIKALKEGIKGYVSSMVAYAKGLFVDSLNYVMYLAVQYKKKVSGDAKIKKAIQELDPEKSKHEFEDFKKTMEFWAPGKKANAAKAAGQIEAKLKTAEGDAISSAQTNLAEAEEEAKNESISNIIYSTSDDVLKSFYDLSMISEAEAAAVEGEEKTTGQKCIDWILGFLGQENLDPEAKTGKKLFWWGKLFLKILSTCLSPILKVVEVAVKSGANLALKGVSLITGALGGPGAFEFALLGGLCAGIVGLIYDGLMLFKVDAGGAGTMAVVKAWLAHALEHSMDLFPSYKTLKMTMAGFCAAMTLWHVLEEAAHLGILPKPIVEFLTKIGMVSAHDHGHEGHGEEHGKEAKPAAAAKPGEEATDAKPAQVAKPAPTAKPAEAKPAAPAPAKPATT